MGEPKRICCDTCDGVGFLACYDDQRPEHCACWSDGGACCRCEDDGDGSNGSTCPPAVPSGSDEP